MSNPSFQRAINAAQQILSDYYIYNPGTIALEDLAFALGLFVKDDDLSGAVATLITQEQKGVISVNRNIAFIGQRRFAIAHEIGHFKLHSNNKPAFFCTDEMFLEWYRKNQQEPEANAFAAELLMPEQHFRKAINNRPPSKELLDEIAEAFQTSLTATCARYAEIGPYPCILFVSTDGKLKWVRASHDFNYFHISIGSDLTARSCAGDYFYQGNEEEEPTTVFPDSWFTDRNLRKDTKFLEYPIYLKRFNTVLSLVWLK